MTDHPQLPPHDLNAERQLLGGCQLDGAVLHEAISKLTPDDFYRTQHQRFFRAMCATAQHGQPADSVQVERFLTARQLYEPTDLADLAEMWQNVIVPASAKAHIPLILALSIRRQLIAMAYGWMEAAYSDGCQVEALLEASAGALSGLRKRLQGSAHLPPTVPE